MKNIVLIAISTFITVNCFAQGTFTQPFQSALIVGGSFSNQNQLTELNTSIGYSFNGNVELGLTYKKGFISNFGDIKNVEEASFSPYVNYVVSRNEYSYLPYSISLRAEYDRFDMSTPNNPSLLSANNEIYKVGASLFSSKYVNHWLTIYPSVTAYYGHSKMTYNANSEILGGANSSDYLISRTNYLEIVGGFDLGFSSIGNSKFIISQNIAYSNSEIKFEMGINFLLASGSTTRRRKCGKYGCPIF